MRVCVCVCGVFVCRFKKKKLNQKKKSARHRQSLRARQPAGDAARFPDPQCRAELGRAGRRRLGHRILGRNGASRSRRPR